MSLRVRDLAQKEPGLGNPGAAPPESEYPPRYSSPFLSTLYCNYTLLPLQCVPTSYILSVSCPDLPADPQCDPACCHSKSQTSCSDLRYDPALSGNSFQTLKSYEWSSGRPLLLSRGRRQNVAMPAVSGSGYPLQPVRPPGLPCCAPASHMSFPQPRERWAKCPRNWDRTDRTALW